VIGESAGDGPVLHNDDRQYKVNFALLFLATDHSVFLMYLHTREFCSYVGPMYYVDLYNDHSFLP